MPFYACLRQSSNFLQQASFWNCKVDVLQKLATLSKDDDGNENDGKKMNCLRSFKLNRVYVEPLNMSNAGDSSWSWIRNSSYVHVLHETSN